MNPYAIIEQYLSPFIGGPNANALIGTLQDEMNRGEQLSVAVSDQLTISTSNGVYLDKNASNIGITRPQDVGISDPAFQDIAIDINATKQVTTVLQDILEIFYGPECVRAYAQATQAEPYALADEDVLIISLEDGEPITITFHAQDFQSIQNATAIEICNVIMTFLRNAGYAQALALPYFDQTLNATFVRIYGNAKGPYSLVEILGGQVQNVLEFPTVRQTELALNNTVWQITKSYGQTIRFRWDGGSQPLLDQVQVGDNVMIYGNQFESVGFYGTFQVTAVAPSVGSPQYNSGWFEFVDPLATGLTFSQPNVAPPSNSPPFIYSVTVTQASFNDLKFFAVAKNTPYSRNRFALAFEPAANLLKIYLPATTDVVQRNPIGAAYIHALYPADDFDSVYGSASVVSEQVQVVNDYTIQFPQVKLDNYATGGILSYLSTSVPIEYVARANNMVIVTTMAPHGITGYNQWSNSTNYTTGQTVYEIGQTWKALQNSGPGYGGYKDPQYSPMAWQAIGPGINYSSTIVTISGSVAAADDPKHPYLGPYLVDKTQPFTLTGNIASTRIQIQPGDRIKELPILGTMPTSSGILLMHLSQSNEEYPIPYIASQIQGPPVAANIDTISQNGFTIVVTTATPSGAVPGDKVMIAGASPMNGTYAVAAVPDTNILELTSLVSQVAYATTGTATLVNPGTVTNLTIDPAYQFKQAHAIGEDITLLSAAEIYTPNINGSDYCCFLTSTAEARQHASNLLTAITALGINIEIIIVYPNSFGLGNGDASTLPGSTPVNDATWIWASETLT